MSTSHRRFTAGRYLQSLILGKGNPELAASFAASQGHWLDRDAVVRAAKAATVANSSGQFDGDYAAVSDSFLEALRGYSVPLRLTAMRPVPFRTRIFVNGGGVVAAEVAEGNPVPVLKGDWSAVSLVPRKFAGISVVPEELARSHAPQAVLAIADDLARATAEEENLQFVSPLKTGSVLYGAPNFTSTGSSVAAIDADLRALVDYVPGAFMPGAAWLMSQGTATALAIVRGSGGARAYPDITPQGGTLLGVDVLITSACQEYGSPPTRVIGLVAGSEILWANGGAELTTAESASLQMLDNPTNDVTTPTATSMVSMFQAHCTAVKAVRTAAWHARSGAAAYCLTGY